MPRTLFSLLVFLMSQTFSSTASEAQSSDSELAQIFDQYEKGPWRQVLQDSGTGNWKDYWFLDGEKAVVTNGPDGMSFAAGPDAPSDADHAVLWTKESYRGDLKVDYEYTRTDEATRYVNILYLMATGEGVPPYEKDIAAWRELRKDPAMRLYYDHMNLYHISYAAFKNTNTDSSEDYIRARRYLPEAKKGLKGTDLEPDYQRTGFFRTGVPAHITVIKKGSNLYMRVKEGERTWYGHWALDTFPPLQEGRIGLRHMNSRSARYRDVTISLADGSD